MMKQDTVNKTLKRIEKSLDLIERKGRGDMTMSSIVNKVAWLRRFGYIDERTTARIADRVCELMPLCADQF